MIYVCICMCVIHISRYINYNWICCSFIWLSFSFRAQLVPYMLPIRIRIYMASIYNFFVHDFGAKIVTSRRCSDVIDQPCFFLFCFIENWKFVFFFNMRTHTHLATHARQRGRWKSKQQQKLLMPPKSKRPLTPIKSAAAAAATAAITTTTTRGKLQQCWLWLLATICTPRCCRFCCCCCLCCCWRSARNSVSNVIYA